MLCVKVALVLTDHHPNLFLIHNFALCILDLMFMFVELRRGLALPADSSSLLRFTESFINAEPDVISLDFPMLIRL